MAGQPGMGRPVAGTGWDVWRTVVGVLYLVAAGFNLLYTLPRGDLDWFADNAWSPLLQDFVAETVMPRVEIFVGALAVFEAAVGLLILSRRRLVDVGVVASVLWVVCLLPFMPFIPMGITNLVLAVLQGAIALRSCDAAIWARVTTRPGSHRSS